jgi:periplasmic divalent cation tolerance protein
VMDDYIQAYTTTASREEAQKIADALVESQLAGCVQIVGPITSIYRWQGKIERAEEWLCVIKSMRSRYAELERVIAAQHSYDTPEIIAVPVVAGSQAYLQWLDQAVRQG